VRGSARYVENLLALVLLAAAALKAWQLSFDAVTSARVFVQKEAALAGLIEAEILLALWLLVGGAPRARFATASICLTLFAVVAGYDTLHAMPSCGCFGNVKVPPVITATFDVSTVIALWSTRPARNRAEGRNEPPVSRRRLALGLTAATLASATLWTGYFVKLHHARASTASALPSDLVVLDAAAWLNKPFILFDDIYGSAPLRTGRWL